MKKSILAAILLSLILAIVVPMFVHDVPWMGSLLSAIPLVVVLYVLYTSNKQTEARLAADLSAAQKNLTRYSKETQVASSQISSVAAQLVVNAEESNALSQQLTAQANEMLVTNQQAAVQVSDTVKKVMSIAEALAAITETADQLGATSRHSTQTVKKGTDDILEIVRLVSEIHASVTKTVQHITTLSGHAAEIAGILTTVRHISDQTHLLALNASIEAARAGDAGLGFSVVAEEIRKLSTETNNAVTKIDDLVHNITADVADASKMVTDNASRTEKGHLYAEHVQSGLANIAKSYAEVDAMINTICTVSGRDAALALSVSEEASKVAEDMTDSIDYVLAVNDVIQRQQAAIEASSTLTVRLQKAASELDSFVVPESNTEIAEIPQGLIERYLTMLRAEKELKPLMDTRDPIAHKDILQHIIRKYSFVEAAWTNDSRGAFIHSIPPAGIANASVRDWFKQSITGKEYVSSVYISAITHEPCVTVSMPLVGTDGQVLGVIGFDVVKSRVD